MLIRFVILIFFSSFINLVFCDSMTRLNKSIDCKCRISPQKRIINGRISHHLAFPFYASLSYNKFKIKANSTLRKMLPINIKMSGLTCSASILNRKFLITSAVCIGPNREYLTIGLRNDNDLVKQFDDEYLPIKQVIIHPNFNDSTTGINLGQNLALIELAFPINFSHSISPACLAIKQENRNKDFSSEILLTAGWGSKNNKIFLSETDNFKSRFLKEIDLSYEKSNEQCLLNRKLMCTRSLNKNDKLAINDLGGSVIWTKNSRSFVVSILSHLEIKVNKERETAYYSGISYSSRLVESIDWIKQHLDDDFCSDES